MLIEYKFYPKHLGPEFLEVYSQIKNERIEAKHTGNKVKNETLKLALNGLSGNLQNEHNFCYSPFAVMQIDLVCLYRNIQKKIPLITGTSFSIIRF